MTKDVIDPEADELNSGHYFEVMDRSIVLCDSIQHVLLSHPAVQDNPEWCNLLEEAQEKIYSVCNKASTVWDQMESGDE